MRPVSARICMETSAGPEVLAEYDRLCADYERLGGYDADFERDRVANGLDVTAAMRAQDFDSLSGGEKTRVNLARLILEDTDILLLDEPTNHLDLRATEWLEEYILKFRGTVLAVSHDRWFLDTVAQRTVELSGGRCEFYSGNYSFYVMTFILPDEGTDLSALLANEESLKEAFTGGTYKSGKVVWSIPKFSYDSSFEPIDALKAMGVTDAFDSDRADFSGISANTPLFISTIRQGTHIGVNENGVEAAAYTIVEMMEGTAIQDSSDTAEMILNRPFLYGITSSDGVLLFVGVCCNPGA